MYIQLGYAEEPRNSLVTKAEFTPSKIGGEPAWIDKNGLSDAQLTCTECSTPYCFIGQIYSNVEHLPDYHRMLYLFACISPQCIKRSDCVKAFRGIVHDRNPNIRFATDEDYNFAIERSEASLKTSRLAAMYDDDNDQDEEDDENENQEDGEDENEAASVEEIKTAAKPVKTKGTKKPLKLKLKEYLI